MRYLREDLLTNPFKTSPEEEARLKEQAKTFAVTRLPYSGERSGLKFDRRTHSPLRVRILKSMGDQKLSWSDYLNGMHIQSRATAHEMRLLYTPTFSANDELLRLVLAQQTYSYICSSWTGVRQFFGGSKRVPQELVENRELLEKLANHASERWVSYENSSIAAYRHVALTKKFGGYLAFRARVAYLAWRTAKDATTIAEELGIPHSRHLIRQTLSRQCWTARRLGLETFKPHHSCQAHVWKLDYSVKLKEIRKYPEPSWKGQFSIEEAVNLLIDAHDSTKSFASVTPGGPGTPCGLVAGGD
jgi:hypothetical protein